MAGGKNRVEIEIAAAVTGAQSLDKLGQSLDSTTAAAKKLGAGGAETAAGLTSADGASKGYAATSGKLRDGMESVSTQLARAKGELLAFVGVQGLANTARDVAALADQWANIKSRLQLALGAQADINQAMLDVEGVSKRTYTSLDATAGLYGKIASTGKEMGVSQQQALALTETINQAIQLSGASAQASEAAVTQLIQGLQGGVVRGDEFNSIMEQSPRLAKAMADGLGVPLGALRGLAEEGKLTSQSVIRAMQSQAQAVGAEFASLPVTIGRAVQNVQTEWLKFVGTMDSATGASASVAAGIEAIGKHLDDLARVAAATGAALTATFATQAAQALRTAATEMAATGGAAALLRRNLDTLSKPVTIAIAVTGFEIGYQVGEMLRENYALARQFGVGVVGFFQLLVNDLRLLKEAAAAVFTSDTVDAALERYVQRNKEIGAVLSDMFADAERAPAKVGAAVGDATGKTQALGTAAQATGAAVAGAGAAGAAGVGKIGKAAEDARGALEGLATVINTAAPADNGITAIVRDLEAAKARGVDVALVLRQQLPEAIGKLSGAELVKFRADFIRAMDEAGLKGKDLRTGLDLIAQQAAKSLGVDVPLAFNTLSESFKSAQANMAVLIRDLPALRVAGVDTGLAVQHALAGMIDSAKSNAEIKAVRSQLEALRKTLGDKLTDGLLDQAKVKSNELADALDKAKPGINSLREALAELGLKSREDLQRTADKAREAYGVMIASGQAEGESYVAWQTRKTNAAAVMLTRMLEANGGVRDAAIESRAAMEGLELQTDRTGKTIVRAMGDGAQGVDGLGHAVRQTTEQIRAQEDAMDRIEMRYKLSADYTERQIALLEREAAAIEKAAAAELKRLNIDKEKYSLDASGKRIEQLVQTRASVAATLEDKGVSQTTAATLAARIVDAVGNLNLKGSGVYQEYDTLSTVLEKLARRYGAGDAAAGSQGAGTAPQTYTVNLNINGRNTAVNVNSAADATALVAALRGAAGNSGLL